MYFSSRCACVLCCFHRAEQRQRSEEKHRQARRARRQSETEEAGAGEDHARDHHNRERHYGEGERAQQKATSLHKSIYRIRNLLLIIKISYCLRFTTGGLL